MLVKSKPNFYFPPKSNDLWQGNPMGMIVGSFQVLQFSQLSSSYAKHSSFKSSYPYLYYDFRINWLLPQFAEIQYTFDLEKLSRICKYWLDCQVTPSEELLTYGARFIAGTGTQLQLLTSSTLKSSKLYNIVKGLFLLTRRSIRCQNRDSFATFIQFMFEIIKTLQGC